MQVVWVGQEVYAVLGDALQDLEAEPAAWMQEQNL
jgi:hypothetical protein